MATACTINAIAYPFSHTSTTNTSAHAIAGASSNAYANSRSVSVQICANEHIKAQGPNRLGFDVCAIKQSAP